MVNDFRRSQGACCWQPIEKDRQAEEMTAADANALVTENLLVLRGVQRVVI